MENTYHRQNIVEASPVLLLLLGPALDEAFRLHPTMLRFSKADLIREVS